MSIETNPVEAMCTVTAGGASFLAGSKAPGCTAVVNGGVGLNDVQLDNPIAATQMVMSATPRTAVADCGVQVIATDATHVRVRTFAAGVLADTVAFDLLVFRIPSV